MTKPEWLHISRKIKACWPAAKLSVEDLTIWYEALADIDAMYIDRALSRWAFESPPAEWPPTLGQLRNAAASEVRQHGWDMRNEGGRVLDAKLFRAGCELIWRGTQLAKIKPIPVTTTQLEGASV